ncbi:MAG: hypothetical protein E6356_16265 [Terrisporobacter othiniensis]|uniref:Uncharacterized protein n=1 Tax=Terrisporobacter hibernicus TaxID=2813371 RepID=A0AAX2ZE44_9FIRM|nr:MULTISPECIES: hypothetical protein [Terrisporobacter]MBN9646714.1 hypothetical protein [Terrisporobacter glycolicus]MDU4859941.1 hypothetical protein [Terrisporobacter othiniensis]MDU6996413.1 hypothetical protein [Terrisporobacter othiniensis]UEL46640.1 hypothetical protein JW646_13455 [Terrisporobacter hibernicus]UPA29728.1 hypothetical protein L0P85_14215 [Terrisporobacter glycolicus]
MRLRKKKSSSNNFILFLYVMFTILFVVVWIYELFISKQYATGIVLTFWQIAFTIAYLFFVKE